MKNKSYFVRKMNMIQPGLNFEKACASKALKMLPNFSIPRHIVPSGNPGSCFVNSRIIMLSCYILKYGVDALLAYDNSDKFGGNVQNMVYSSNLDLVVAVNSYIEACKSNPYDTDYSKTIYYEVASILQTGNATICSEMNEDSFFKIIQYNKLCLDDADYRNIIRKEINGTFTSFMIIVSGTYEGELFIGHHETFLFYHNGRWILFDDLDCYRGIYTGRYLNLF